MRIGVLSEYGIFDSSLRFPDRTETNWRTVTEFEIEYFISCTGRALVDDRIFDIRPGTLLLIKPGQKRRSILGFTCYYFHIDVPRDSDLYPKLTATPDFYQIIDNEVYRELFEELARFLLDVGYQPDSPFVNGKILEIFHYLFRDADCNKNGLLLPSGGVSPSIQRAIAFLEKNYQNRIDLAALADYVGYSPNYFQTVFTKVMGKSPLDYLLGIRIRHAKYLLARSRKELKEIALECGFSSQSYFITVFKRVTFSTPAQYRKCIGTRYIADWDKSNP